MTVPPSPGSTTWDIIQVSADFSRLEELITSAGYARRARRHGPAVHDSRSEQRRDRPRSTHGIGNDLNDPDTVSDLVGSLIVRGSLTASNIYAVTELVMDNGMIQPVSAAHRIGTNRQRSMSPQTLPEGIQAANGYLHVVSDVPLPND